MPKSFRQCEYCANNSYKNPEIVIFLANENLKYSMNIQSDKAVYICQTHFHEDDIRVHGTSKRLIDGAIPLSLPSQSAVNLDHPYLLTTQLDMTSGCEQDIPDELLRENITDDETSDVDNEVEDEEVYFINEKYPISKIILGPGGFFEFI